MIRLIAASAHTVAFPARGHVAAGVRGAPARPLRPGAGA